jgi:hypothetical protein
MDLAEFRQMVNNEFGNHLEHATPDNVRNFLDRMQFDVLGSNLKGRLILDERASSYEEIVKDFFSNVLELPQDESLMMLWLLAFDLVFSAIELHQADRFKALFGE